MDDTGTVDFSARYLANGLVNVHRENSVFRREDGAWVYVTGEIAPAAPGNRVGRNDPCPCGSGKTTLLQAAYKEKLPLFGSDFADCFRKSCRD